MSSHGRFLLEKCYVGYEEDLYIDSSTFNVDQDSFRCMKIYAKCSQHFIAWNHSCLKSKGSSK